MGIAGGDSVLILELLPPDLSPNLGVHSASCYPTLQHLPVYTFRDITFV